MAMVRERCLLAIVFEWITAYSSLFFYSFLGCFWFSNLFCAISTAKTTGFVRLNRFAAFWAGIQGFWL
jgi:hypothetical protein